MPAAPQGQTAAGRPQVADIAESSDATLCRLLGAPRHAIAFPAEARTGTAIDGTGITLVDVTPTKAATMEALGFRPKASTNPRWRTFAARTAEQRQALAELRAGGTITSPCLVAVGTLTAPAIGITGGPEIEDLVEAAGLADALSGGRTIPMRTGVIATAGLAAFMAPGLARHAAPIMAGCTFRAYAASRPVPPPWMMYLPTARTFYLLDDASGSKGDEAMRRGFAVVDGAPKGLYATTSPAAARSFAHLTDPDLAFRLDGLYDRWPFAFANLTALQFEQADEIEATGGGAAKVKDAAATAEPPIGYDASDGTYFTTDLRTATQIGLPDLPSRDDKPRWGFRDLRTAIRHRRWLDDHAEAETLCRLIERAVPTHIDDVDERYPLALREGQAFDHYQVGGVRHALRGPVTVIADDMGTGKTIMGTSVADCVRDMTGPLTRMLVAVPASQLDNWTRTLANFPSEPIRIRRLDPPVGSADAAPGIEHLIQHYRRDDPTATLPDDAGPFALVVSYEVATRDARIAQTEWDLVIFDEAHNLKNPSSQRGRALGCGPDGIPTLRFARSLWMTGTEITAGVSDMWQFIAVLLHKAEPLDEDAATSPAVTPFKRFRQIFQPQQRETDGASAQTPEIDPDHQDVLRARRLARLAEAMDAGPRLRRLKAEVMPELKAPQRKVWRITPPNQTVADAARRQGTLLDELERTPSWNSADRIRLANSVNELRLATSLAKVPTIARAAARLAARGEPILLFSHHIAVAEALQREMVDRGLEPTLVHGQNQTPARRGAIIRAFQDGRGLILNTTIAATYAGYQITRPRYVFFAELDWKYKHMEQAIDRANRRGQTRMVQVRFFVIPDSFDDRIANNILEKSKVSDIASGDDRRRLRLAAA